MEVAASDLRAHLGDWLDRARAGEEVVVTKWGIPVARLVSLDSARTIDRLTREGVISRPRTPGRPRASEAQRVTASKPVSDLVGEQRR